VDETQHAMGEDQLLSARRIRQPIESKGDVMTAFDAITYKKGAAVIAMFEQWVGADSFRRGVTRHLQAHADGNATSAEFLAAISAEAGRDVASPFSTFLDQGGVPVVAARLACDGGKGRLELSQSRYLPLGTTTPARDQLWQIPVCARTDAGRACTLLSTKSGTLDLPRCPAWVTANAAAAGYYRTALDSSALDSVSKHLAKLTSPEKMMHFYDVVAAARAGVADEARVLQLVQALAEDPDHHVVQALLPALAAVREAGLVSDEEMPRYQRFVRSAFARRARTVGFEERKGETESARLLRPQLLGIEGDEGGDGALRAQAQKLALRWLSDHQVATPEVAEAALFLSALDADALLYQRLHDAAKAEKERPERMRILKAMAQVRDPGLVQQGFRILLSDEFDPREALELLWGPSRQRATRDLAVEFTEKNFDAIAARMPRGTFGDPSTLSRVVAHLCDAAQAAHAEQFFRPRMAQFPGGDRLLSQSLEKVRQCAAFREKQAPLTARFFRDGSPS
jgi:alanyl aminopeptidase